MSNWCIIINYATNIDIPKPIVGVCTGSLGRPTDDMPTMSIAYISPLLSSDNIKLLVELPLIVTLPYDCHQCI